MSIPDALLIKYYELLTDVAVDDIRKMKSDMDQNKINPRDAKAKLGKLLVKYYHGEKQADAAEAEFKNVFAGGGLPSDIPSVEIARSELDGDGRIWIAKLLVLSKLAPSTSEARRLVGQGGVRVGDETVRDESLKIKITGETMINVGKRKYAKVKLK